MQALAERLDETLRDRVLRRVVPLGFSALKTVDPPPTALVDRPVRGVGRRGKYLVLDFGVARLMIHLSQGGRIDIEPQAKTTRPKGGVVRLVFEGGPGLLVREYGTQRKASWWVLGRGEEGPLAGLGLEATDPAFEDLILATEDGRRIHTFLRDQRTVTGIGRGYADEILHEARVSPFTPAKRLSSEERGALVAAAREMLARGLELERKRKGGLPAKLSGRWTIHGRHGEPCPRCSEPLKRVSYESYEITYCARCQTDGKVLADRRLSRLVK